VSPAAGALPSAAFTGIASAECASGGVFAQADMEAAPQRAIENATASTIRNNRWGRRIGVQGIETYGEQVNRRGRPHTRRRRPSEVPAAAACLIDSNARAILYIARRDFPRDATQP
jgi:hypothetical protein